MEKFLALVSRIKYEISELQIVVKRVHKAWNLFKESGDPIYIDSVALNLHNFYSGVERIFELVAEDIDDLKPKSSQWHKDLLKQMSLEIPNVRPAVISLELREVLDEYRAFRHLVRNVYSYQLNTDKMRNLIENLDKVYYKLVEELDVFCRFLEG